MGCGSGKKIEEGSGLDPPVSDGSSPAVGSNQGIHSPTSGSYRKPHGHAGCAATPVSPGGSVTRPAPRSKAEASLVSPQSAQAGQQAQAAQDHAMRVLQHKAWEILETYNSFFEHIAIRKGWRIPPFTKEEVQIPFQAAAEVVSHVRARLDQDADGIVLRQLDGSASEFMWGWTPGRSPLESQDVLEEFFRGLVLATLSDRNGLVEGLTAETVESYTSCHRLIINSRPGGTASPNAAAGDQGTASPAAIGSNAPIVLGPGSGGASPAHADGQGTAPVAVSKAHADGTECALALLQPQTALALVDEANPQMG